MKGAKQAVGFESISARLLVERLRRSQGEITQAMLSEVARLDRRARRLKAAGKVPTIGSFLRGDR